MSFPDLRSFIDHLHRDRDIVTVDAPVERHLEVAEIHRRVIAAGGPALLFTNVTGSGFRLVTNLFGTARRAELAFGERPLRLIRRVVELAETMLPPRPAKLWGARDVGLELLKVGTKRVTTGPVAERVTSDVQLDRLPAITCWPEDGGPFITLPLVYTTHPDRVCAANFFCKQEARRSREARGTRATCDQYGGHRDTETQRKYPVLLLRTE